MFTEHFGKIGNEGLEDSTYGINSVQGEAHYETTQPQNHLKQTN